MKVYRVPIIAGSILAVLVGLAGFAGYSVILYYCWVPILFALVVIAARTIKHQPSVIGFTCAVLIVVALSAAGALSGHWGRRLQARSNYKSCQPILELLQEYRADHGHFPAKLTDMKGFAQAQRQSGLRIAQGEYIEYGVDLHGLNSHDALIYLEPQFMSCVVPVTKQLPLSFTRLYIYGWNSDHPSWEYQKLIWTLSISRS